MIAWRVGLAVAAVGLAQASAQAESPATRRPGVDLRWRRAAGSVDAHLTNAPLDRVLGRVAGATGWRVFVEPGPARTVSANFTNLPPGEALHRLLGGLSFVLVPGPPQGPRLLVYGSAADAATERVQAAIDDGDFSVETGPIPNELIVRIKRGAKVTPEELAAKLGARLVGRLDSLGAYRLAFDSAAAAEAAKAALLARDDVAAIENNVRLPPPEAGAFSDAPASANTLKPRIVPNQQYVVAAIIDTPVQTLSPEYEQFVLERRNLAQGAAPTDGTPTHGTVMVESFLQAVGQTDTNPNGTSVRVLAENIYGTDATTTTWQVANGLVDAAARGATIFNLSLGGPDDSPMLAGIIASISSQGGLVFAAAGNTPGTALVYPAADPGAIGVTALGADGLPASYADTGPQARLAAPGSTYVPFQGRMWMAQGTSGATATISGLAAGLASQGGQSTTQIQARLFQMAAFQAAAPTQPTP